MLIALITLALIFDFLNGFHDSSNIVATVISTHALKPRTALLLTALGEFIGPFLFGVAVAKAVGEGLLLSSAITLQVMIAALVGAIIWNLITFFLGIPSSSSHALIGGLLGAAITGAGFGVIQSPGLIKILIALFISPPLGFLMGYLITKLVFLLSFRATPRVNQLFKRIQIPTSFALALSHGANDAQKTMGVITLGLVIAQPGTSFEVPVWVIFVSAAAIALGTSFGGWRLIRTLGGRIFRVRPVHGLSSQVAGASVILGAALLGGPVSTTQVMSSSIMGAGAAERVNMVRWHVARDLFVAWVLTIPVAALVAAVAYLILSSFI
ncbi:MAG: inorganic phosphate transporter [Anaerolineae bacterium]|nr:inorganic phosphate transporter [Anaerolineae bacterium]